MALIFDRNNKVSPVCILIGLEMASSENPTINLDPIHSKGGSLGEKPSIRGRRDVVTATNRPARSKWKFVAVLFAITMAFSVIVAALLSGNTIWTTLVTPATNVSVDSSSFLKEKVCSSDEKVVVKTSLHQ